jgi:serine/threonine protein phosphatase 1
MSKEFVIGDIHGEIEQLNDVLAEIWKDYEPGDKLILLGDYIDRGKDSAMVYRALVNLRIRLGQDLILIRGNHEQMMYEAIYAPDPLDRKTAGISWLCNGGDIAVQSFERDNIDYHDAAKWLHDQTVLYYETENAIYVHAGLNFGGVEATCEDEMLWMRPPRSGGRHKKLVVVGHSVVKGAAPLMLGGVNMLMMDAGGCFLNSDGAKLVGYEVTTKKEYKIG